MYCLKCGALNDDNALFCSSCGADFRSLSIRSQGMSTTQRDPRQDALHPVKRLSLVDALHHTFKAAGFSILREPTRVLGYTSDIVDTDASDFRVFERNCDRDTLAPFVNITSRSFDAGELDDAANRTYLVLCDRSIDGQAADAVAKSLRNAVARCASLPEVAISPIVDSYSGGSFGSGSQGSASQQSTNRSWSASSQSQNESQRQRRTAAVPDNPNRFNDVDYMPQQSSTGSFVASGNSQGSVGQYPPFQPYAPQQPVVSPPKPSGVHPALVTLLIVLIIAVGVATYAIVIKNTQEGGVQTEQVTIAFSGGSDAKGKMSTVELDKDGELTLPDCDYTRKGYSFDYWRANGEDFSPGDTVTVSEDTTFTATWTADKDESDNEKDGGDNNSESSDSKSDDSASTKPEESPVTTAATPTQESQPKTQSETQPETQKSPAESFPHKWQGTYIGTSSYVTTGDHHITRAVAFDFSTVMESGYLEGICYVGTYDRGAGETYGTCYVSGNVDWNTGAISLRGTGWIDHGELGELREYSGSVDFSAQTMAGTAWDVGTGNYETPWNISAVSEIAIEQNGSMTRV